MRCRAGCILDLNASEVMYTLPIYIISQSVHEGISETGSWILEPNRKCVSREVLPCIALWWAWRCESLKISREVGVNVSVIWDRLRRLFPLFDVAGSTGPTFFLIASSIGVCELAILEMLECGLRNAVCRPRRSIWGRT